jgi:hypothetical protein
MPITRQPYFLPTQITGCSLWLDSADLSSFTLSGSSVTQWRDKSGSNNNATPYSTSPQRVGNSVLFSGGHALKCGAFLTSTSCSVFIVNNYISGVIAFGCWKVQYGSAVIFQEGSIRVGVNNTSAYAVDASTSVASYTANRIYGLTLNSSTTPGSAFTFNGSIDGTNVTISGTSTLGNAATCAQEVTIGGLMQDGVALYPLNGYVYEVVVYNYAVTGTQRQQVEGYLAQKWNLTGSLPAGHPGLTSLLYRNLQTTFTKKQYFTAFSPKQIAGCTLWLDAADPAGTGVLPANNSTLSTWADKSGNGVNMTGASSQPTFLTNAFNGKPTVSFAATQGVSSQYLTNSSTNLYNSVTNVSIFFVIYIPATTPNFPSPISLFGKVTIYMKGGYSGGISAGSLYPWSYNNTGPLVTSLNNYVSANNYYICCFQFNTNQTFFMNGDTGAGGPTAFTFGSSSDITTYIGYSGYNTNDGFNGYISEIIIYNTVV